MKSRKMLKNLLAVMLLLSMFFTLSACGGDEHTADGTLPSSGMAASQGNTLIGEWEFAGFLSGLQSLAASGIGRMPEYIIFNSYGSGVQDGEDFNWAIEGETLTKIFDDREVEVKVDFVRDQMRLMTRERPPWGYAFTRPN
ncbi:MAG: hypothetical protein FWE21_01880 [Defluviitaleaceae bacterium]|nr:hypothetical protein [Defluviitaleaceae bacterium]